MLNGLKVLFSCYLTRACSQFLYAFIIHTIQTYHPYIYKRIYEHTFIHAYVRVRFLISIRLHHVVMVLV